MLFQLLRRPLLALAFVVPLSAAHSNPATAPAPAAGEFAGVFTAFGAPEPAPAPTPQPAAGIAHTQPGPAEVDEVLGRALGSGNASFYAARFDGRRTASGETFDNDALTAAHRTLPFGSKVRVTNPANGRSVVVRINDRGPFGHGRLIDVSKAAAHTLGLVARGHGRVDLALLD